MIISTLILAASLAGSTAETDVTVDEAKRIAFSFLLAIGESSEPAYNRAFASKGRVPEWEIVLESEGVEYVCSVYRTTGEMHSMVSSLAFPWEAGKDRTGEKAFLTESLARSHVANIVDNLRFSQKLTLDVFEFSEDTELPGGRIKSGRVYGRYFVRVGGFRFIDRSIAVSILLDSQSGKMISYSSTLDMAVPTSPVTVGISKLTAQAVLQVRHFRVEGYLVEKGWYLPDGETTARLGWRFMKDTKTPTAFIVDAQNKDVYKVRGKRSVKLPGTD